ncbi:MAG: HAD hydrolase family protein, partial [Planctomycetes bacterium]|nr:HAD hydrolase family protein [Planctomycetota bacterium]
MTAENSTMIYISDMDGTLLRNDGTVSPYTRQKLTELLNASVNITIASARSAVSIRQILAGIPFRLPVIEINGAFVTDFATGKHLIINEMSKPLLQEIYSSIIDHLCRPFVTAFDGNRDRLYYEKIPNEGMQLYHDDRTLNKDIRLTRIADLEGAFADHVVALTVINTYEKLKPLADQITTALASRLETHFFENPYSPGWWWLTIHD